MKTGSGTLTAFLAANKRFVMADLYTFTLPGGTVLRYSSSGKLINFGGFSYLAGPRFVRSGMSQKRGIQVDSLTLFIYADARPEHAVNGVPMLTFIKNRGFDSAILSVTRVFALDWDSAWVGGYISFLGRLSEVIDSGTAYVQMKVNSGLEVLDANMPADVYQASCLNTLFDTKCAINRAGFQATGTVASGAISVSGFPTSLTQADGYFSSGGMGTMLFTTGANAGIRRTVKTYLNAAGAVTFVAPFPSAPAVGDAFQIWPGCDLSQGRCSGFFNNLTNFRGQPYIPIPETMLGGVAQQSTAQQQPGQVAPGGRVTNSRANLA